MELIEKVDSKERFKKKQTTLSWCHLMATLVSETFPVRIVNGFWCKNYQHSWVETEKGNIIDVSPIGCRSLPVLYPGVPLKNKKFEWKKVFVENKTKKEKRIFETIYKSKKFKENFSSAKRQTKKYREHFLKLYIQTCLDNNITPLIKS